MFSKKHIFAIKLNLGDKNMSENTKKRISKAGEWMRSNHEPVVDFSVMTEKQIDSMYRAILR